MSIKGSCLCGTVRFEINGELNHFFLCHCQHCRKDTGSAHAANVFSSTAQLHWLSGETQVKHFRLKDSRHGKSFCSECGSALPWQSSDPELLVIPAGSLDEALPLKPQAHLFTASKADWDDGFGDLPRFAQLPDA